MESETTVKKGEVPKALEEKAEGSTAPEVIKPEEPRVPEKAEEKVESRKEDPNASVEEKLNEIETAAVSFDKDTQWFNAKAYKENLAQVAEILEKKREVAYSLNDLASVKGANRNLFSLRSSISALDKMGDRVPYESVIVFLEDLKDGILLSENEAKNTEKDADRGSGIVGLNKLDFSAWENKVAEKPKNGDMPNVQKPQEPVEQQGEKDKDQREKPDSGKESKDFWKYLRENLPSSNKGKEKVEVGERVDKDASIDEAFRRVEDLQSFFKVAEEVGFTMYRKFRDESDMLGRWARISGPQLSAMVSRQVEAFKNDPRFLKQGSQQRAERIGRFVKDIGAEDHDDLRSALERALSAELLGYSTPAPEKEEEKNKPPEAKPKEEEKKDVKDIPNKVTIPKQGERIRRSLTEDSYEQNIPIERPDNFFDSRHTRSMEARWAGELKDVATKEQFRQKIIDLNRLAGSNNLPRGLSLHDLRVLGNYWRELLGDFEVFSGEAFINLPFNDKVDKIKERLNQIKDHGFREIITKIFRNENFENQPLKTTPQSFQFPPIPDEIKEREEREETEAREQVKASLLNYIRTGSQRK